MTRFILQNFSDTIRRKKAHEGASLGRTESVRAEAQPGHSRFCVLLRALRACPPCREA